MEIVVELHRRVSRTLCRPWIADAENYQERPYSTNESQILQLINTPKQGFHELAGWAQRICCCIFLFVVLALSGAAADNWYGERFRKLHLDYHLNPWVRDAAASLTLEEARRQMRMFKDAGVESVEFFAYDHFGAAFYPSDVVRPHPSLRNDYFGNMRQAARENGIRAVAYVNVFGSVYLFAKHPDWYIVDKTGTKYAAASWLPNDKSQICASSPFLEEVFKPLLKEMITRYSPDAVWLDGGSWLVETPCYCRNCRTKYRAFAGDEIPDRPSEGADDAAWRRWLRWVIWRRSQIYDYLISITKFIHQLKPEILVTDNNVGRNELAIPVLESGRIVRWAHPREMGLDFLSCDPVPFGGDHPVILSKEGREQSTLGMPFDYANERFQGWGEWTIRETADFKVECATIMANGGRCFFADQPWLDGTLEPEVYRRLKETYDFVKPRENAYRDASVISEIGVLSAETNGTLARNPTWVAPAENSVDPVAGAHLALVQEGYQFQILGETGIKTALTHLKMLIVPEQVMLLDDTLQAIHTFVDNGGSLLVTGQSGRLKEDGSVRPQGQVEGLLGVRLRGERRAPINYLEFSSDFRDDYHLPAIPFMVRGPMYAFEADNARLLANTLEPRDDAWDENGHWRQYTVTGAMPPNRTPAGPGALLVHAGKGQVLYVAGNWFTTYRREGNPAVRKMLVAFVSTLLPEREQLLWVENKPLRIETNLMQNGDGYLVSLVNSSIQKQSTRFVHVEELIPVSDLRVNVRIPQKVRQVRLLPEGTSLHFTQADGQVRFTVPRLEILSSVQLVCERLAN